MTHPTPPRGGAPVGFLTELPQVEAAAVCFLRHWCESSQTQKQVIEVFSVNDASTWNVYGGDDAE